MRISDWSSDVCSSDLVTATGPRSRIGEIGRSLSSVETEAPRLQHEMRRIVRICATGGIAVAALVVLLYGLVRGGWLDALLAGIAIGMSLLPEEFPVVLAIFMAMGAWRIAQVGVLTRRSEEHTSELQSLMRISYAVFCLK